MSVADGCQINCTTKYPYVSGVSENCDAAVYVYVYEYVFVVCKKKEKK